MKVPVILKGTMSGPEGTKYAGEMITVQEEMAEYMVNTGQAEYLNSVNKTEVPVESVETASIEPEEKAVKPKAKPRTRKRKSASK